jgi:hypothetical protein
MQQVMLFALLCGLQKKMLLVDGAAVAAGVALLARRWVRSHFLIREMLGDILLLVHRRQNG